MFKFKSNTFGGKINANIFNTFKTPDNFFNTCYAACTSYPPQMIIVSLQTFLLRNLKCSI